MKKCKHLKFTKLCSELCDHQLCDHPNKRLIKKVGIHWASNRLLVFVEKKFRVYVVFVIKMELKKYFPVIKMKKMLVLLNWLIANI